MSLQTPPKTSLVVYNTLTRRKEEFSPLDPPRVRMYACGPTVYDHFHIGNARAYVSADLVRRYLEYRGYEVTLVQNITDIEDKIIRRAREEGITPAELAAKFTKVFFDSTAKLGIRPATHHPRATEYVGKMVEAIGQLIDKGYAYAADGDVYFRVGKFSGYGKLSGRKLEDLLSGARVEVSEQKEDPMDFTLWKVAKEGEPSWPSPWGAGRPGWHIECSVMSMDLLGPTLDIHMGGVDLVFPHHENEIAQSEALTGQPFAHYWLHNGFLNIDNQKMSKSLGNFFSIDEVLAKFEAPVVRYFFLGAHYRAPLDFSDAALKEASTALLRLREARRTAAKLAEGAPSPAPDAPLPESLQSIQNDFQAAMDDDFNTPRALAALFDCVAAINQLSNRALDDEKAGNKAGGDIQANAFLLGRMLDKLAGEVLGLDLAIPEAEVGDLSEGLMRLIIEVRALARKEKQWALADQIRKGLTELGITLHDRPGGATEWEKTQK